MAPAATRRGVLTAALLLLGGCAPAPSPVPTAPLAAPTPTPTPEPVPTAHPPATATATATALAPEPAPAPTAAAPPTPAPRPATPTVPAIPPRATAGLDPRFGIAEGFRNPAVMAELRAGWDRVVLSWADIQPDGPDDFSWLGRTVPPLELGAELRTGVTVAGLLQFTPLWARERPEDQFRSPPRNLDLPYDHPDNYWGQFVYQTVKFYTGRIDEWIIWNEPEFRPTDPGAGGSYTWLGSDQQFARLMQVGYLAAKRANPGAVVSFPGTSYWVDEQSDPRREQFYERYLRLVAGDRDALAHGLYHDAVSLNLYRAPDDIVRVGRVFEDIQARHGAQKPLWLLELNAMPTDDADAPCAQRHAAAPLKTTMEQQAAYAIQALALAAAAGYQRVGFYKMVDGDACEEPALWGIARDDGRRRPVADTLGLAIRSFSGYQNARFVPLERGSRGWSPWPSDPESYVPNWQVYQVVLDMPGNRRVTVLWNGDGDPRRVRLARHGTGAHLVDRHGREQPLPAAGDWTVPLPGATAHAADDPPRYFYIGGDPVLVVAEGVYPATPTPPPRLA